MGKIIGGGLPAAAYGGSRALMERIAPAGDVYQAGTLSGNPLAVAAGLATLRLLDDAAYVRLGATTEALAAGLRDAAAGAGVPVVGRRASRPADRLLRRDAAARLRGRPGLRPRGLRRLVPRAAGPRRLPAGVAVRGLVPVAGPHRRAPRPHAGRGRRGVRRAVVIARAPRRRSSREDGGLLAAALRDDAGAAPTPYGDAVARGPRLTAMPPTSRWSSRRSARATSCTTASRACMSRDGRRPRAAGRRPPLRARASSASRRPATSRPSRALADLIALSAQAQAPATRARRCRLGGRLRRGRLGSERRPRSGQSAARAGETAPRAPRSSRAPLAGAWRRTADRQRAQAAARTMNER